MYYYTSSSQQNTNATANTDTLLHEIRTVAASHRARLRRVQCGCYLAPTDNQVRLRMQRLTTVGTFGAGSSVVPAPHEPDAPAANVTGSSLPTLGTGVLATVFLVNMAFNLRNSGLWVALTEDEAHGIIGAGGVNGILILNSQATVATVPVNYALSHSE